MLFVAKNEEQKSAARISLPLSDDGLSVDWSHVRQSTAAKFESLLRTDPKIRQAYQEENGMTADGETVDPFGGITQENVHALLDSLGKANSLLFQVIAGRYIKHPFFKDAKTGQPARFVIEPDIMQRMAFTPKQHEELDPRATKIAQKYSNKLPSWLREHMDLYMFGTMFIAYTVENAKAVLAAQYLRDLAKAGDMQRKAAAQPKGSQTDSDVPVNGVDRNPPPEFSPSPAPSQPESEAPTA